MEKKAVRRIMGITQEAIRFSELRSPIPDVPSPTRSLSRSLCADADAASTIKTIKESRIRFILLDVLHELSLIDHKLLINYRIFLDTNILIDYIDDRAGADDAEQIFACGFLGEAQLFASSLTFANMAYIIKGRTQEEKYDALRQMAGIVEIVNLGKQEVMAAIATPVKDFEDMLQYQCAKEARCDYIVTNV